MNLWFQKQPSLWPLKKQNADLGPLEGLEETLNSVKPQCAEKASTIHGFCLRSLLMKSNQLDWESFGLNKKASVVSSSSRLNLTWKKLIWGSVRFFWRPHSRWALGAEFWCNCGYFGRTLVDPSKVRSLLLWGWSVVQYVQHHQLCCRFYRRPMKAYGGGSQWCISNEKLLSVRQIKRF